MENLVPALLWILLAIALVILLGSGIVLWRKQRDQTRRTELARQFGITLPNSVVFTPIKDYHPVGSVEYRLPRYLSGEPGSSGSQTVVPASSTLIFDRWMFSSVYPTHISDLAWQLRSRGHSIPLSPEEEEKARKNSDYTAAGGRLGRCELADFAAQLPADLAARIDPDSGVPYL